MKIPRTKPASLPVLGLGVVALLLVLTSTGGAVAGALITSKQIKDNTITSADIKNNTLAIADVSPSTASALRGSRGPTGPTGAKGDPGLTGPTGPMGANGMTDVTIRAKTVTGQSSANVQLLCQADERAVSAGVYTQATGAAVPYLVMDSPIKAGVHKVFDGEKLGLGGGWWAEVRNMGTSGTVSATLNVFCAKG